MNDMISINLNQNKQLKKFLLLFIAAHSVIQMEVLLHSRIDLAALCSENCFM